jgi:uroporphyrinogen decarboxylase
MINNSNKLLLKKFCENNDANIPIWLMRQAGRYLPEYRKVREHAGNFLDLCYNPELATEVTIQPITRFGFDASIIFSDILVIPHAMGMKVEFLSGEGPVLEAITQESDIDKLDNKNIIEKLDKVYQAISLTKSNLPSTTTLIGFAGSPWTIATYMIEGKGSKDFSKAKNMAYLHEKIFSKLIEKLVNAISTHLILQIKAGAEVVQIFDSWCGVLNPINFQKWVIDPTAKIVANVKQQYPNIPFIGFPKGAGLFYKKYVEETRIDGVSIDANLPLDYIQKNLINNITIQGNLDPIYLLSDKQILKNQVLNTLKNLNNQKYIFNLGHGIIKETPIENVEYMIELIRDYK